VVVEPTIVSKVAGQTMFRWLVDEPGSSAEHSQQLHLDLQATTMVAQQATYA
jgi:hypothetical protein